VPYLYIRGQQGHGYGFVLKPKGDS
jgi:hypothetical protein